MNVDRKNHMDLKSKVKIWKGRIEDTYLYEPFNEFVNIKIQNYSDCRDIV